MTFVVVETAEVAVHWFVTIVTNILELLLTAAEKGYIKDGVVLCFL
jgi:hypothetical protein